jgi:hypothetical protein
MRKCFQDIQWAQVILQAEMAESSCKGCRDFRVIGDLDVKEDHNVETENHNVETENHVGQEEQENHVVQN